MIKYIKSFLWGVAKRLSYIEEARCLKVKLNTYVTTMSLHFTLFRDLFKTCKGNDRTVRQASNTVCGKKKKKVRMYLVTLSHTVSTNDFDLEK